MTRAADAATGSAVEIVGLAKVYAARGGHSGKQALKGVSLAVPSGSIFGLLGPNGAGKSTLINILAGLVIKSSGRVQVCGIDIDREPRAARAVLGIVPQELSLDPYFPARDAIELQAGLFGIPKAARRTDELLAVLGLADKADAPARSLSGGMRRRLMVAKALVHSPPILVLDEPTAGVDVELRQKLWDYVRRLNHAGTTVLLTTHYLHEAEALCDRIAVLVEGEVLVDDSTDALLERVQDKELRVEMAEPLLTLPDQLRDLGAMLAAPRQLVFRYGRGSGTFARILTTITDAGIQVRDLSTSEPTLEAVFLDLIRRRNSVVTAET